MRCKNDPTRTGLETAWSPVLRGDKRHGSEIPDCQGECPQAARRGNGREEPDGAGLDQGAEGTRRLGGRSLYLYLRSGTGIDDRPTAAVIETERAPRGAPVL